MKVYANNLVALLKKHQATSGLVIMLSIALAYLNYNVPYATFATADFSLFGSQIVDGNSELILETIKNGLFYWIGLFFTTNMTLLIIMFFLGSYIYKYDMQTFEKHENLQFTRAQLIDKFKFYVFTSLALFTFYFVINIVATMIATEMYGNITGNGFIFVNILFIILFTLALFLYYLPLIIGFFGIVLYRKGVNPIITFLFAVAANELSPKYFIFSAFRNLFFPQIQLMDESLLAFSNLIPQTIVYLFMVVGGIYLIYKYMSEEELKKVVDQTPKPAKQTKKKKKK